MKPHRPPLPRAARQPRTAPRKTAPAGARFVPVRARRGAARSCIVMRCARSRSRSRSAVVTRGPLTVTVLEEGKTRIRHRYIISPPVAGYLNRVPLRAGDRIEAGKTVLATIQPQPASFLDPRARAEAEARVKAAEAAKMQRETQIERARAALDLAQKELVAREGTEEEPARSPRRNGTPRRTRSSVLTRELHTAEFAPAGRRVRAARRRRPRSRRSQTPATENAEPLKILAPVTGFVLNVFEESARIVTAGTQIMEVGDPTDLEAEIELLSSDAVGVQPGADVSIEQWGGDAPLRGKVTRRRARRLHQDQRARRRGAARQSARRFRRSAPAGRDVRRPLPRRGAHRHLARRQRSADSDRRAFPPRRRLDDLPVRRRQGAADESGDRAQQRHRRRSPRRRDGRPDASSCTRRMP